jgi:hypothetical protein
LRSVEIKLINRRIQALKRGGAVAVVEQSDSLDVDDQSSSLPIEALQNLSAVQPQVENQAGPSKGMPDVAWSSVQEMADASLEKHITTLISTEYVDEFDYPRSSIPEVLKNSSVPNKFRVLASVKDVRPMRSEDYVLPYCTPCRRLYVTTAAEFHHYR